MCSVGEIYNTAFLKLSFFSFKFEIIFFSYMVLSVQKVSILELNLLFISFLKYFKMLKAGEKFCLSLIRTRT